MRQNSLLVITIGGAANSVACPSRRGEGWGESRTYRGTPSQPLMSDRSSELNVRSGERCVRFVQTSVPLPGILHSMSFTSLAASLPVDGRQSATALKVARGTTRLLHAYGLSVVSELPLASGRRADLVALGRRVRSGSSRSSPRSRISAPTRNGWTTGCIATACSSPPRWTCRARSSRRTPGSSSPMPLAPRSFARRRSTGCTPRPAET